MQKKQHKLSCLVVVILATFFLHDEKVLFHCFLGLKERKCCNNCFHTDYIVYTNYALPEEKTYQQIQYLFTNKGKLVLNSNSIFTSE